MRAILLAEAATVTAVVMAVQVEPMAVAASGRLIKKPVGNAGLGGGGSGGGGEGEGYD